jgi:hypothetical protein
MSIDEQRHTPIACTLTPAELSDRAQAWAKLLGTSLISRQRIVGGLRLRVHPGAMASLRALIDLERDCCPWINFGLKDATLVMTAAGAGENALVGMFSETAPGR